MDYDNHQKGKWRTKPQDLFEQLIAHNNLLTALEAGRELDDPDAINSLAVITAHGELGKDKGQVVPTLRDAAAKGSLWARWNLVMACGWELEGYGVADHAAAIQEFKKFCDGATGGQLYELVILMATTKRALKFNDHAWVIPDDLTLYVLRAAAGKGDRFSADRLKRPNPEAYPY